MDVHGKREVGREGDDGMTRQEEDAFRAAFNVRRVEKCYGTCRHFEREYEDCGCGHPRQAEFDSWVKERKDDPNYAETYGAYGGILVDEGYVCDLWERIGKEDGK